jgi:cell division protein FtsZ
VSVVATGLGQLGSDRSAHKDRESLSQRLAGLASVPAPAQAPNLAPAPMQMQAPAARFEPARPARALAEAPNDAQVFRTPGNVTIERRPPQLAASAPPAMAQRPVRRMPNVEEFPLPVQNELKARAGAAPAQGLAEQKKKVGFLERLTGVARYRKDEDAAKPEKREPEFTAPKPVSMMPKPVETLPKGLKIERAEDDNLVTGMPKRIEAQPNVVSLETREPVDESPADDDLEIPAFLRRRAK